MCMMFKQICKIIVWNVRKYKLQAKFGCLFGNGVYIDSKSIINGYIDVQKGTSIIESLINGGNNIGRFNSFVKCQIGKYCIMGDYNRNIYGHHPVNTFVSMHSFFYQPQSHGYTQKVTLPHVNLYKYADKEKKYHNIIGNDVYVTNNVLLIEGVKVGNGAVITPGSVVTKNVPPYAIVRGNPAKVVAYRFKPHEIKFLEKLQWWDKDDEWLRSHADDFCDIKLLMKRVIEEENWDESEFFL